MVTTQTKLEIVKQRPAQCPTTTYLGPAQAESRDSGWCSLPEICQLLSIPNIDAKSNVRFQRRRIKAGQWLFGNGEKFSSVFIVYSGFLKTLLVDEVGNEQILGFPMKGDLLGIDGLHNEHYASQAAALTDCDLVVVPFHELKSLGHEHVFLENWLYRAMGRELVREHAVVGLLGTLGAEARVARFLVSLSDRFAANGYSPVSFNLRMTRKEIGSYLGLTLETVSRSLSALHDAELIEIKQRAVEIKDIVFLRSLQKLFATPQPKCTLGKQPTQSPPAQQALALPEPSARLVLKTNRNHSIWADLANM